MGLILDSLELINLEFDQLSVSSWFGLLLVFINYMILASD